MLFPAEDAAATSSSFSTLHSSSSLLVVVAFFFSSSAHSFQDSLFPLFSDFSSCWCRSSSAINRFISTRTECSLQRQILACRIPGTGTIRVRKGGASWTKPRAEQTNQRKRSMRQRKLQTLEDNDRYSHDMREGRRKLETSRESRQHRLFGNLIMDLIFNIHNLEIWKNLLLSAVSCQLREHWVQMQSRDITNDFTQNSQKWRASVMTDSTEEDCAFTPNWKWVNGGPNQSLNLFLTVWTVDFASFHHGGATSRNP